MIGANVGIGHLNSEHVHRAAGAVRLGTLRTLAGSDIQRVDIVRIGRVDIGAASGDGVRQPARR